MSGERSDPLAPQEYPRHEGLCFRVCVGWGVTRKRAGVRVGWTGSAATRPPHPGAAQLPFHPLFFLVSLSGPDPSTFAHINARSLLRAGVFVWGGHGGAGRRPGGVTNGEG